MPQFRVSCLALVVFVLLASCASLPLSAPQPMHEIKLSLKTFKTENYEQYQQTEKTIGFTIDVPLAWEVSDSVILDTQGHKIAEFSPGFVEGNFDVFEKLPDKGRVLSGPDSESTVLDKARLVLAGRRLVRVSESAVTTPGTRAALRILVDQYYLQFPRYLFVMAFQYAETARSDEGLIRRILESVRLVP